MHKILVPATAGLILLAAFPALAEDDLDLMDAPEVQISATSAAQDWYARADFGYAAAVNESNPSYRTFDGATYTAGGFDDGRFARPFSASGGIGYRFSDGFRADVTADIFQGDFNGTATVDSPCSGAELAGTSCATSYDAEYRSIGAMVNVYADLGTVMGLTPYVGAGIGASHVSWTSVATQPACVAGGAACSGTTYGSAAHGGEDSFRFSYALMAGISYDVTDRVKLDVGYRYSDIAGGGMTSFGAADAALGAAGSRDSDHGFARHEVRAGLRVALW